VEGLPPKFTVKGLGGVPSLLGTVQNMDLGLDADKPAAGMPGRLWFSVDIGVVYFDDGTAWTPVAVSATAELVDTQAGVVTGLAITAAGVVTANVVLPTPYPTSLDRVFLTLRQPTAQNASFGGLWTTNESKSGFTLNLSVVTASTTAGATVNVGWETVGH